ncbi:hypothetical protein FKW77_001286 [Venturia effusa]|uniref:AB hydrolase-1 domain-containing protein n=1 Tax=Venturia effusa TaxID=50376 RepID=A0A517KZ09_9PEZI|nr:hypothetical protein FKW77_001286 [Venturia effusa]
MSYQPASYILTAGAASLGLFFMTRSIQSQGKRHPSEHVVSSPLKSLAALPAEELRKLPYPPDLFPGARDVDTPYGSIRVYEWGPERGRKVLLVHGISTPCMSLGIVAENLVQSGCRVMMFDLFGRGYSDNPSDVPHDTRLYTTQILLALASSPLAWSGTNAFSIVGYSLGGGISTSFTSAFPTLVASLVIIAPSGILREHHIAWQSKILFSTEGFLPESLIHWLVKRRMAEGPPTPDKKHDSSATDAVKAETGNAHANPLKKADAPLFPHLPTVTIGGAVQWQIQNHAGFLPAFISAIRHAPITAQHPYWRKIGERLTAQKVNSADAQAMNNGLWRSKVLMILGSTDPIIIKQETEEDAEACLGKGNVETVVIEAGHEVPMSKAKEVTKAILRFWGEDAEAVDLAPEPEVETGT